MKLDNVIEISQNDIDHVSGASFMDRVKEITKNTRTPSFMERCQDECKGTDYSRESNCMSVCFWVDIELRRILDSCDNDHYGYRPYRTTTDCSEPVRNLYYGR